MIKVPDVSWPTPAISRGLLGTDGIGAHSISVVEFPGLGSVVLMA